MNRYQIYLDPREVAGLDRLAADLDLSRSQIIRDVVSRVMREFEKAIVINYKKKAKNNPLLRMCGIGKSSTGNISMDVDSIYFRD